MKRIKQFGSAERPLPTPLRQDVEHGKKLYRTFNDFEASQTITVKQSRLIPPVVVDLGELVGIIYRSDKGQPGQPQAYIHFMQTPPRLVSNIEGTQLYIVGGSYQITPRGIEG
jgi:hypothetical protein